MGDFSQNGDITTLQKLGNRSLESLEAELEVISRKTGMVLLLPALYSEFETPAMQGILEELRKVKYLHKIVLGLDRANAEQFAQAKRMMRGMQVPCEVIWNDGPRVQGLLDELREARVATLDMPGKGRNVWTMLGYALNDPETNAFALHDCDIVGYSREIVARLLYPLVHPALDFEFNKGYYARVTDRLHGRATRLLYAPLMISLEKILGVLPYLNYMNSFRYALSGEIALNQSLARSIRISPTWGLEVSTLSEVFRSTASWRVCQTEIADNFEHKHQVLGNAAEYGGLMKMACEIAKTVFRVMSQQGVVFTPSTLETLKATFFQEARQAIVRSHSLAYINGLEYDRRKELEAVEVFQEALALAGQEFGKDPMGVPSLKAWFTVRSILPDFTDRFAREVQADNQEA
jgi:glucosyl-3-phosphoglycerate synthase